jgi:hypothetical protein
MGGDPAGEMGKPDGALGKPFLTEATGFAVELDEASHHQFSRFPAAHMGDRSRRLPLLGRSFAGWLSIEDADV